MTKAASRTISGDATDVERTQLNVKGGSMTAILKKPMRAALPEDFAYGARLDFGAGVSCVVLAPGSLEGEVEGGRHIHVTRVSDTRLVLDLVDDAAPTSDPMELAFLRMVIEQFKRGERTLAGADEADAAFRNLRPEVATRGTDDDR